MSISNEEICKNPVAYINQIKAVQNQQELAKKRRKEESRNHTGVMILRLCMEATKDGENSFELPESLGLSELKILEEKFFVRCKRTTVPASTSHSYEFSFTAPE